MPSNLALSGDVSVQIAPDGTISGVPFATDDPNTSPTGFTYSVTEAFQNAPGRTYNVGLPSAAAQPIDLLAISPGSPNQGTYIYVTGPAGPTDPSGASVTGSAGAVGSVGAAGPAGPRVAAGGAAGQFLKKNSGTTYNTV